MKRILWALCAGVLLMVSCTANNTPDDPSGTDTTTNVGDDDNDFVENQSWISTVSIVWNGASATVSGEVDGVSVTSENGYVVVTSTAKHVEYSLSGTGTGQMKIYSDNKFKLNLNSLSLTCSDGPAINNQCKKTCYTVVSGTNVLTDGSSYATSDESQKAAFFSEGQLVFTGDGSLGITGNYKHALASDDYIRFREGMLNLVALVSDGMHANDGIIVDGGSIAINAAGDGIQCDTSSIVVKDGSIAVTSAGDKGILAYGNIEISGGTISVNSTGKGIKTKSDLLVSGGNVTVIAGGTTTAKAPIVFAPTWGPGGGPGGRPGESSGVEGIEAKGKMTFTGGIVFSQATDDAINSGGDMVINGGTVCAYSTGNDGLDANGNCYIQGGLVYAIGASSPEVAIDANSEERKQLYVQGGTLVAIGGLESGASLTQTCYSTNSWSANKWYALTVGKETFAFLTPASAGSTLVVSGSSKPTMESGISVTSGTEIFNGMGVIGAAYTGGTTVSLSTYSGNSGGRPGW